MTASRDPRRHVEQMSMSTVASPAQPRLMRRERRMKRRGEGWLVALMLTFSVGLMSACVGDKGVAPDPRAPGATLGSIVASPVNVIMAVGDSFPATFTARALDGTPVTSFDSVRYLINNIVDTLRIRVSPSGMVTARSSSVSSPVLLTIFAYKDGAGAVDQVVIQVTDTKFGGATLSIHPTGSDSARLALGNVKTIRPIVKNLVTSQSVSNPRFRLSTDSIGKKSAGCYGLILPFSTSPFQLTSAQLALKGCAGGLGLNQLRAFATGTPWIHADALVYGVMLHDSVQYTLTNTFQGYAGAGNNNLEILCTLCTSIIAPYGQVNFRNSFTASLGISVTFAFDTPDASPRCVGRPSLRQPAPR